MSADARDAEASTDAADANVSPDAADATTDDSLTPPYYASPTGSGSACTRQMPCSLAGARDKVRTLNQGMTSDVVVYLLGGTYALSETFELVESAAGPHDSGTGGHDVVYKAAPSEVPIVSGGKVISGFARVDTAKDIWRADVGDLDTRQLYVDGVRAQRAHGPYNPQGFTKTATGYVTSFTTGMDTWQNLSDVEVVSLVRWKSFRCGVENVSGNTITMKSKCWQNALFHAEQPISTPSWLENAYELLDEEGEFYLNKNERALYYKPRAGEDMTKATVIAPVLETIVRGTGTPDVFLHNLRFEGITFAYGTWLEPSGDNGYPVIQAGYYLNGSPPSWSNVAKTPGNVTFAAANAVRFERNVFTHLGCSGLVGEQGSHDDTIVGNVFEDISSSGIVVGDIDNFTDEKQMSKNNVVKDNYVTQTGLEYHDTVAIFLGYSIGAIVDHNEVSDAPYSAVSVGWGWDGASTSIAGDNHITHNHLHDYMKLLYDGGGVYTLSVQTGSTIEENYIHDQARDFGGVYLDQGTRNYSVHHNVFANVPQWLFIWMDSIRDNAAYDNWTNTAAYTNAGTNNDLHGNVVVAGDGWPDEAEAVMSAAGLEPAYQDIKNGR